MSMLGVSKVGEYIVQESVRVMEVTRRRLGPAIVLSKLYANSIMVLFNDRIPSGHGRDGHTMSGTVTTVLDSHHFATVAGRTLLKNRLGKVVATMKGVVRQDKWSKFPPTNVAVLYESD